MNRWSYYWPCFTKWSIQYNCIQFPIVVGLPMAVSRRHEMRTPNAWHLRACGSGLSYRSLARTPVSLSRSLSVSVMRKSQIRARFPMTPSRFYCHENWQIDLAMQKPGPQNPFCVPRRSGTSCLQSRTCFSVRKDKPQK